MVRALVYVVVFYIVSVLFLVLGSWLLLCPRSWAMAGLAAHGRTCVWLLDKIVGTGLEVRGRENLPDGPVLVASKHQSAWDTFALVPLLHDPAIIMKRELMWIPFYGWFSAKFGMIFVRRGAGASALRQMARDANDRVAAGRQILIFPKARGANRVPRRHTSRARSICMTGSACRAVRWPSTPGSIGRGAVCGATPARSLSSSWNRSRRDCRARISPAVWKARSKRRPTRWLSRRPRRPIRHRFPPTPPNDWDCATMRRRLAADGRA